MNRSKSMTVPARSRSAAQRADLVRTPYATEAFDAAGHVEIDRVAENFGMSKAQLAEVVGLPSAALHRSARANAGKTQGRVREMLEIVDRISGWAGGTQQALAWYRAQPISAFGDRTAEALVKSGQVGALRDYLDSLALGGFA
jgi:uncharacterized protein (DUF2384 family)